MGRRSCCVNGCNSNSLDPEHNGVTYHAFPQDEYVRTLWRTNVKLGAEREITRSIVVCSRHFRRQDFNTIKSGKYVLKPRVFPSVYPWGKLSDSEFEETRLLLANAKCSSTAVGSSPGPKLASDGGASEDVTEATVDAKVAQILAETAAAEGSSRRRSSGSHAEVLSLEPGMLLEVKEAGNVWLPGRVIEYNAPKNEVLIRFERNGRSRPQGHSKSERWLKFEPGRFQKKIGGAELESYAVGERCMARWSALGMYACTVQTKLAESNDTYEVIFDDGFTRTVHAKDMSKLSSSHGHKLDDGVEINQLSESATSMPNVPGPSKATSTSQRRSWGLMDITKRELDALKLVEIPRDGEWTCHWVNDQPIGKKGYLLVGDHRKPTVIVDDWRLPPGWVKHMYQRSNILGKWDVILVAPTGKRFRSKSDLKQYLDQQKIHYNPDIYDFSIHRRRAKDINAYVYTPNYTPAAYATSNRLAEQETPVSESLQTQPEHDRSVKSNEAVMATNTCDSASSITNEFCTTESQQSSTNNLFNSGDDFAYIGAFKVQIVNNLFRCPGSIEGCNKLFRKEEHMLVHVHHYHKELSKQIGACPKMQELAEKRTHPDIREVEITPKNQIPNQEFFAKLHQQDILQSRAYKQKHAPANACPVSTSISLPAANEVIPVESQLPVQVAENISQQEVPEVIIDQVPFTDPSCKQASPTSGSRKSQRQRTTRRYWPNNIEAFKPNLKRPRLSSLSSADSAATASTAYTTQTQHIDTAAVPTTTGVQSAPEYINENGEVIKIVRMRQEEIIHCVCLYQEEDGLMIQCELCLTWQHGGCHNIYKEADVPEKYVCSYCRRPKRERASMRYKHDQDWLFLGKLPTANYHMPNPNASKIAEHFKATNTLAGNSLETQNFLRSLQAKVNIVSNPAHPKLYLWAQEWDKSQHQPHKSQDDEVKQAAVGLNIPQPEAAINTEECRCRLMKHIDVQKAYASQHLDELEAELERLEQEHGIVDTIDENDNVLKEALSVFIKDLTLAQKMGDINILDNSRRIAYEQNLIAKEAEASECLKQESQELLPQEASINTFQ